MAKNTIFRAAQAIQLAEAVFGTLSKAERQLLERSVAGKVADYSEAGAQNNNPSDSKKWSLERTLRSEFIAWVCTDDTIYPFLTNSGLKVLAAKVIGSLDFQFSSIRIPLEFKWCAFEQSILLKYAKIRSIDLSASSIVCTKLGDGSIRASLEADGVQIAGDICLGNGFSAEGISICRANIDGDLDCRGGKINGRFGFSLRAHNTEVRGTVFLSNKFEGDGSVEMRGVKIGGDLDCRNGSFGNRGEAKILVHYLSLSAQLATIRGSVFLIDGFKALGEVSLSQSTICGDLVCNGGAFQNCGRTALSADGTTFKRSVSLSKNTAPVGKSFSAIGKVVMSSAFIGGNLDCRNGKFFNRRGIALQADMATVQGSVLLRSAFKAVGEVYLSGIIIGEALICTDSIFYNRGETALCVQSAQIKDSVFLGSGFKATGEVSLSGANIGSSFICSGIFDNSRSTASDDLKKNSLLAQGVNVSGITMLEETFEAKGVVNFVNANIDLFEINAKKSDEMTLILEGASVRIIADSQESWPPKKKLFLNGFTYRIIDRESPSDSKTRLEWIRRQPSDIFFPQPYKQLAQALQVSGHEAEATDVLIGMNEDRLKAEKYWSWSSLIGRLFGLTIAYGYKSNRALLISSFIVLFGSIIFHIGYATQHIEPVDLETYSISVNKGGDTPYPAPVNQQRENSTLIYPEFFSFAYSLDVFLPIIDLHQENYWLPRASKGKHLYTFSPLLLEVNCGGFFLAYFWMHTIAGWVFTSLWVAGFTGIVRRIE